MTRNESALINETPCPSRQPPASQLKAFEYLSLQEQAFIQFA